MGLTKEERSIIVSYRIERAKISLEELQGVVGLKYWNLAANRMYYSVYYAASALLISRGHDVKTHSGVMALLNQYFVKTGILTIEDSRLMSRLFQMRQTGDYSDCFSWSSDDVLPMIPPTEELVARLTSFCK